MTDRLLKPEKNPILWCAPRHTSHQKTNKQWEEGLWTFCGTPPLPPPRLLWALPPAPCWIGRRRCRKAPEQKDLPVWLATLKQQLWVFEKPSTSSKTNSSLPHHLTSAKRGLLCTSRHSICEKIFDPLRGFPLPVIWLADLSSIRQANGSGE